MNPSIALNLIGYGAVLAGGLVLGTIFGRKLASEFAALVRAMEARMTALETAMHFGRAAASGESAAAAIKAHAAATEKLAAAIETRVVAPKQAS
jgi:energy-coupling factor transporter transmembrane protein EcfT